MSYPTPCATRGPRGLCRPAFLSGKQPAILECDPKCSQRPTATTRRNGKIEPPRYDVQVISVPKLCQRPQKCRKIKRFHVQSHRCYRVTCTSPKIAAP